VRGHYAKNAEQIRAKKRAAPAGPKRRARILYKYGLTEERYNEILVSQGGRCAICRIEKCKTGRRFAVDHDHGTGKVRGILCSACNIGIGHMQDDPELLRRAADYLETSR
jgi:hypothetical protein